MDKLEQYTCERLRKALHDLKALGLYQINELLDVHRKLNARDESTITTLIDIVEGKVLSWAEEPLFLISAHWMMIKAGAPISLGLADIDKLLEDAWIAA